MKTVMTAIFRHKRLYSKLPFFEFLRQESVPPLERLAFYPCMAPFILAFGDMNKYVLRDEFSADPHQKLVNAHSYEDDHHWPWYLDDFTLLGFDMPTSSTEVMRFLFGDGLRVNRMLMTKLAHLIYDATPVERLVIIEAIEETGNVLFGLTSKIARQIEAEAGIELKYTGEFHFKLETGHAMGSDDHAVLAAIPLDDDERSRCLELVDEVFRLFEEWTGELLAYARKANSTRRAPARFERVSLVGEGA